MVSIRSSRLSFTYSDRVPLLTDVEVHLEAGWTGLVGPNGAGKTTFLRLLAGELEPAAGEVRVEPRGARRVLCRQSVEQLEPAVRDFAAAWDGGACRLRGVLGLEPEDLERWPTLSPGERRRWQIGAALFGEPDVLLLDEPTNHLDAAGRGLLVPALRDFPGVGVLVSHDRAFVNAVTASTLRLEGGTARLWPGGYDAARGAWLAEEAAGRDAYETLRREERKLRRRLADTRRQQGRAQSRISHRARMKNKKDHDATSMAAKNRVRVAEGRLGRQAGVVRRSLEKTEERRRSLGLVKAKGRRLFVDFEPAPRQRLLALDASELRAGGNGGGETVVLRDVHVAVDRDSRIEIAGPNGSGKSTLLRALMAASTLPPDRLLYLPQELAADEADHLLAAARGLPPDERGRVLELVAALGVDPERLLASASPSPGEARKLALAFGLGRRVWALLLDEPTNHLDVSAIERLEEALRAYPGALALVTHDEGVAQTCCEEVWRLTDGRLE